MSQDGREIAVPESFSRLDLAVPADWERTLGYLHYCRFLALWWEWQSDDPGWCDGRHSNNSAPRGPWFAFWRTVRYAQATSILSAQHIDVGALARLGLRTSPRVLPALLGLGSDLAAAENRLVLDRKTRDVYLGPYNEVREWLWTANGHLARRAITADPPALNGPLTLDEPAPSGADELPAPRQWRAHRAIDGRDGKENSDAL